MAMSGTNGNGNNENKPPGILWSCVSRNDVILAEATPSANTSRPYDDVHDGLVQEVAINLMKKKPTPGWEFYTLSSGRFGSGRKLKGIKFHVYDHHSNNEEDIDLTKVDASNETNNLDWATDIQRIIWIFGVVYDPNIIDQIQVQSFIEKIVLITEHFRDNEYDWNYGPKHSLQQTFSPTLQQRMDEISYLGKMAMLNTKITELETIMSRNIELILDRETKLETLKKESNQLNEMAAVFKKQSKDVRRRMLWQNAKHGLVLGTAITAGVATVVTPIVVALV